MTTSASVRSMTGFARNSVKTEGFEIDVELRAVNHRFLEVSCKLPRLYSVLERDIRAAVQKTHKRGRIEVSLTRRVAQLSSSQIPVDVAAATAAWDAAIDSAIAHYSRVCKRYDVSGEHLADFIGQVVLKERNRSEDSTVAVELSTLPAGEGEAVLAVVEGASVALLAMRETEGAFLAADIGARLTTLDGYRDAIALSTAELPSRFKKRLEERIGALVSDIPVDPNRLAVEVALLAERTDVSEELSRLGSHMNQFRTALGGDPEGIGRKLDFLVQEFGREFNTIASKAQDAKVQALVVDAKAELEKIREQLQNLE